MRGGPGRTARPLGKDDDLPAFAEDFAGLAREIIQRGTAFGAVDSNLFSLSEIPAKKGQKH